MISGWHLWVIVSIVLFIAEVLMPTFVPASFGVGCLFSAATSLLGLGLKYQIAGFIAGTLVSFFGVRPFFTKYCYRSSQDIKTNVDALIGKTGRVSETISEELHSGRVLVGGDDWKASAIDGATIEKNEKVEVIRVEGATVFVRAIKS